MQRPVLILRPEPGASATAERARAAGLEPIVRPLFRIAPRAWEPPPVAGIDALLLTSANAARTAGAGLLGFAPLPTYVVGEATAAAARSIGASRLHVGESDAQALVRQMIADGVRRAFHPGGADRVALELDGIELIAAVTYASEMIDPPPDLDEAFAAGAVALLHSIRAARRLSELVGELVGDRNDIAIATISEAVRDAAGDGWRARVVAEHPGDDALLAAAARLCQ